MPGQDNDKDYQLIHRFWEGELSEEEQQTVDKRVQADPSFAEKVARLASSHQAARELRREELHRLYPGEPPRQRTSPPWWVWAILAIGLAAGLYFLLVPSGSDTGEEPVALATGIDAHQMALNQSPDYFDEMGGDWKSDYRAGRYAAARQALNATLDKSSDLRNLSRFCYYAGLLNLYPAEAPPDLKRAVTYLEIARPEVQEASLYLIIAYVEAGQLQEARALSAGLPEQQMQRLPAGVRDRL